MEQVLFFEHNLKTTRSVRRNLDFDRPIEQADLYACIDVAVQAPTGLIGEGWRFLVVTEAAKKAAIAALYCETLTTLMAERGLPLKSSHQALMWESRRRKLVAKSAFMARFCRPLGR
jgi:nitroreductase